MHTATLEEVRDEKWLNNLKICLCGNQVLDIKSHDPCIISGITRGLFETHSMWKEYCVENGKRVAEFYRNSLKSRIPGKMDK